MGFIVYSSTTRLIHSIRLTQDQANTVAGANADLLADTTDRVLPRSLVVGEWYFTAAADIVPNLPFTALENLKIAARSMHAQLLTWTALLTIEGVAWPVNVTNKGHDWLAYGHDGAYQILHNAAYTNAQKIAFCEQMKFGASDVTDPHSFYQEGRLLPAPTRACVWVDPRSGARMELAECIGKSYGTAGELDIPALGAEVRLANGAWIEDLTE